MQLLTYPRPEMQRNAEILAHNPCITGDFTYHITITAHYLSIFVVILLDLTIYQACFYIIVQDLLS